MEINLRMPRLPYFVLSVALDVLAAGLGVLGGAENAMLAVKSKRGVEAFVRRSAQKLAEWRGNAEPELAPVDEHELADERGSWTTRYAPGDSGNRYPAARYGTAYERSGLPFTERR